MKEASFLTIAGINFGAPELSIVREGGYPTLKVVGGERRVEFYGGEICRGWLTIPLPAWDMMAGLPQVEARWGKDDGVVADTFISISGGGFSLLEGHLTITRLSADEWRLEISGVSDLVLDGNDGPVPYEVAGVLSSARIAAA